MDRAARPVSYGRGHGNSDSIMDWLLDLRLESLWPNFEKHGCVPQTVPFVALLGTTIGEVRFTLSSCLSISLS